MPVNLWRLEKVLVLINTRQRRWKPKRFPFPAPSEPRNRTVNHARRPSRVTSAEWNIKTN